MVDSRPVSCQTCGMDRSQIYRCGVSAGVGVLIGVAALTGVIVSSENNQTVAPVLSGSEVLTSENLASLCRLCGKDAAACSVVDQYGAMFCLGVVTGVLDGSTRISRLCLPKDWAASPAETLFLAWAARNPNSQAIPAAEGIVRAHTEAFDCDKKPGDV